MAERPVEKVLVSWSGGKDSAMALEYVLARPDYEVAGLLTTVTEDYDRISMHGVRRALLRQQAESLGLPLEEIGISKGSSNAEYESKMAEVLSRYKEAGVSSVVFGDIFLEDLRRYREKNLAKMGMRGIFPPWNQDTQQLVRRFIDRGFRAVVVCVDTQTLDQKFAGREIDEQFVGELPETVDVCGENGEYHSFVYEGPIFKTRIPHTLGEVVLREGRFCYCDLVPAPC
ncbi:MAG: diphthine--ammonia ligase [Anaerolineae bacterium]